MKFWSILKDSFREALDCKVLYVMVGLSCLVFLFVASFSYEPMPAETTLKFLVSGNFARLLGPSMDDAPEIREAPPFGIPFEGPYGLHSISVVNGIPDSPDSEYLVVVQRKYPDAESANKVRESPDAEMDSIRRLLSPKEWDLLHVESIKVLPTAPAGAMEAKRSLFFEIKTQPTPATRRLWSHELIAGFGAKATNLKAPLGLLLFGLSFYVLFFGSLVAILVSIIITAFFIPNMLRKGTVDFLLAKPISRWSLLMYKYLGGLFFILLNTSFTVIGIWVIVGLRSGIWANSFLLIILVITFYFAILYAVSTLSAVMTESAVVTILVTCGAWVWFSIVGIGNQYYVAEDEKEAARNVPVENRSSSKAFPRVLQAIHVVTPRTSDLRQLGEDIRLREFMTGDVAEFAKLKENKITWESSIIVSVAFVALMLGLACWRFAVKDY